MENEDQYAKHKTSIAKQIEIMIHIPFKFP